MWGVPSGSARINTVIPTTQYRLRCTDARDASDTVKAGESNRLIQGAPHYAGPECYVSASGGYMAAQSLADADGVEATAWTKGSDMATMFILPVDTQHIVTVCRKDATVEYYRRGPHGVDRVRRVSLDDGGQR